jgi:hypothetical protein
MPLNLLRGIPPSDYGLVAGAGVAAGAGAAAGVADFIGIGAWDFIGFSAAACVSDRII